MCKHVEHFGNDRDQGPETSAALACPPAHLPSYHPLKEPQVLSGPCRAAPGQGWRSRVPTAPPTAARLELGFAALT